VTAGKFLGLLWAEKPADQLILVWTLPDKRSHWCSDVAHATMLAENLAKTCDVYVGVGLRSKDMGSAHRGGNEDVSSLGAMWSDIDLKSDAHPKDKLPLTTEEGLQILPPGVPPTVIIHSGNGLQAWWIFKEPWRLETPEERERAVALAARWQTMLRQNSAIRGWGFDRLSDLSRVLRVPGTLNHKDPENLKDVVVTEWHPEIRYEPSDIDEILDGFGIPDADAAQRAAVEWASRFNDVPLRIDTSVQYPVDRIDGFCSQDMRFNNTWFRQRHDLKDQSQSGYDMALAMFGASAKMKEQDIVDLIITHRNLHHQKHRLNPDYYQRTIAKAYQGSTVPPAPLPEIPGVPGTAAKDCAPQDGATLTQGGPQARPTEDSAPPAPPPDPARVKAILCDTLSDVLGIHILRMFQITGKEPSYQIELEDATVELSSVSKILEQGAFRAAIAAQTRKLINKIKPRDWDAIAQKILDALIVKDGGEEASLKGAARLYLDTYLSETQFISSIETQTIQTIRKPTILASHPGQIAICASDLQVYLTKVLNQNLSVKAVASMLSSVGCQCVRATGKFREQSRWLLPAKDFAPKQYMSHIQEQEDEGVSA
jgi:hypothetical protein